MFTVSLMWQTQKVEIISVKPNTDIRTALTDPNIKKFQMIKIYMSQVQIVNQHLFNKHISPVGISKKCPPIFLFLVSPVLAVLSKDMSCSCERCTDVPEYHFYYKRGGSWVYSGNTKPTEAGIYTCRAVWKNKRSALSNTCICEILFMDFNSFSLTYNLTAWEE